MFVYGRFRIDKQGQIFFSQLFDVLHKVIGTDVSKVSFDVACFENGLWKYAVYSNDEAGFRKLSHDIKGSCHCMMEASGPYYLKLALFLHSKQSERF